MHGHDKSPSEALFYPRHPSDDAGRRREHATGSGKHAVDDSQGIGSPLVGAIWY